MGTGTVSQPADFYVAPFAWLHGNCRATQDLCCSDTFLCLLYTLGRHAVPPCRFGTVHVFLLKCVPPVSLEVSAVRFLKPLYLWLLPVLLSGQSPLGAAARPWAWGLCAQQKCSGAAPQRSSLQMGSVPQSLLLFGCGIKIRVGFD